MHFLTHDAPVPIWVAPHCESLIHPSMGLVLWSAAKADTPQIMAKTNRRFTM
jgi:hypothetical protein